MLRFALLLASLWIATPALAQEPPAAAPADDASTGANEAAPAPMEAAAVLDCAPTEAEAPTGFARWDALFGEYFVGTIAKVLFWDVWFWDNDAEKASEFKVVV
ncbi:MAG: hypothetical protein VX498_12310, partial [Myxococcota bacterium]|nr:hypothetical protein [Myxococcota bacterium]